MNELFKKPHQYHVKEIPLAPVLDLLVVVIFFLVISTSFTEFTKQTIPPSSVSTITDPVAPPPLAPKMLISADSRETRLILRWAGSMPDQKEKRVLNENPNYSSEITNAADELIKNFIVEYPAQKSVQLGLGALMKYQDMVSAMDGIQKHIPDVVLVSASEADAIASGTTN